MQNQDSAICRHCRKPKVLHSCGGAGRRYVPTICRQCGNEFAADKGELKRGRAIYCSKRCYGDAKTGEGLRKFWSRVDVRGPKECWPFAGAHKSAGYGQVTINREAIPATHVAWELMYGEPVPPGMYACHMCDSPSCCNPAHLFVDTAAGNSDDKVYKNRQARGGMLPQTKLTVEQVGEIRRCCGEGMSQSLIAERFGVTQCTVSLIVRRRTWRHVA